MDKIIAEGEQMDFDYSKPFTLLSHYREMTTLCPSKFGSSIAKVKRIF